MPKLLFTIQRPVVRHYAVHVDVDGHDAPQNVLVNIKFLDESITLFNPYDLDACHQILVGDPSPIEVYDISDHQWEDKKIKLEFADGEGGRLEIWAERIDHNSD